MVKKFDLVVMVDQKLEEIDRVSDLCRKEGVYLSVAMVKGWFGFSFSDFGFQFQFAELVQLLSCQGMLLCESPGWRCGLVV